MRHSEFFTGRVGQIKDVVELANGNCVVNFSVAETVRVKKGDNWEDGATIWTNVAIFGDQARNLHRSVKPGTFVTVIGTRSANEYTPKDSTEKVTNQSVIAEEVAITITKFNYVETIGNVNYAKDGTGVPAAGKSTAKPAAKSKAATKTEADPFASDTSDDDPFGDNDDPFGLTD